MPSLNDLRDKITKVAGNKQFIIILFVAMIFLVAALYTYKRFVMERINKNYVENNEFVGNADVKTADIYFFFTTWCPHCKTAKPEWDKFKDEMNKKIINGYTLNFFEVDCDKDVATSDKFNVKGFPTIKMMKGNQIIEYDAKPNRNTLVEFVNSSLV